MATRESRLCLAIHYREYLIQYHLMVIKLTVSRSYQLGGLHSNAYISDLFAQNFAKTGMKAYVEIVQRRERELGTDVLTHQKVCSLRHHDTSCSDLSRSGVELIMPTILSRPLLAVSLQHLQWGQASPKRSLRPSFRILD